MRRLYCSLLLSISIFLTFAVPALAQSPVITITTGTIGEIIVYGGQLPLENHIVANGSSLNQTTYNELYQVFGCIYGCDATTFDIPDLRHRFILGRGDSYFTCGSVTCLTYLGDTGGLASVALTIDEMPAHSHPWRYKNGWRASGTLTGPYPEVGGAYDGTWSPGSAVVGGTSAHNNIPPYVAINYLIRYQQDVITFTVSSTPTATPTNTPTPTATPTGTVTIYLPNIDAYTHTLSSGKTLAVPVEISFGQLFVSGAIILVIGVVAMRVLFGGVYRE